jgi:murein DD-endopeptidase MepM/ murein hydrolase activator NlpD
VLPVAISRLVYVSGSGEHLRTPRQLLVALGVVATLGIGALALRQKLPLRPSAEQLRADSLRAIESRTRRDTLRAGETLDALLRRGGLDGSAVRQVLAAATMIDPRRVQPGLGVAFVRSADSLPPDELKFKLDIDHLVRVVRVDSASWSATEERIPWTFDTVVVHGAVSENLYDALRPSSEPLFPGASREAVVLGVADVYKFRVDMSRELQVGDSVYAVIVRAKGPEATTRVAAVLATRLQVAGRAIEAFHYVTGASSNKYYDAAGKSLATAFLRSPIDFARITSGFGSRFHPVLKIRRAHEGVDYGAVTGTPVQSIGDGTVIRSSSGDGYGNVVEVRHPNGFVTRYAHLSRFSAKGRRGNRVEQGEVIGYVGSTGLATGPHLHFEILVGGNQISPSVALRNVDGTPLPDAARPDFEATRRRLLSLLTRAPGVVRLGVAE